MSEWDAANDLLNGTQVYGNPKIDSKAWSIKYDEIPFNEYKVESGDNTYSIIYRKEELQGQKNVQEL